MNTVFLSDPHFDAHKNYDSKVDRLKTDLKVIDECYEKAKELDSSIILLVGDLFNTVEYLLDIVTIGVLAKFRKLIDRNPKIVWYAITGNHDLATKNLPGNPAVSKLLILSLAFPDNFVILDNDIHTFSNTKKERVSIAGIPYYEHKEHFQAALGNLVSDLQDVWKEKGQHPCTLLIHQNPSGLEDSFIPVDTFVTDPLYAYFDLVVCGHYHGMQKITDKFVVLGNPAHKDGSDIGLQKGIWSCDLRNPAETLNFHDRKGKYPEIVRAEQSKGTDNEIVLPATPDEEKITQGTASVDDFSSSLPARELLENYWKEKGDGDEELLEVGLSFIK